MSDQPTVPIAVDACEHPELCFTNGLEGQTIVCRACSKKITLPMVTLIGSSASDLINLMLINFGARWADWFQQTQFPHHTQHWQSITERNRR